MACRGLPVAQIVAALAAPSFQKVQDQGDGAMQPWAKPLESKQSPIVTIMSVIY
jgi:hypothetical protein